MLQAFQDIYEETIRPLPVSIGARVRREDRRAATLAFAASIEALSDGLSTRMRRVVMERKVDSLARIAANPSAAVARADCKGFSAHAVEARKAIAQTEELLAEHLADRGAPLAASSEASAQDRAFATEIAERVTDALEGRLRSQRMLADFFDEAAAVAKARFEFLTTDPHAYDEYAERVKRGNPAIMAYLAR